MTNWAECELTQSWFLYVHYFYPDIYHSSDGELNTAPRSALQFSNKLFHPVVWMGGSIRAVPFTWLNPCPLGIWPEDTAAYRLGEHYISLLTPHQATLSGLSALTTPVIYSLARTCDRRRWHNIPKRCVLHRPVRPMNTMLWRARIMPVIISDCSVVFLPW